MSASTDGLRVNHLRKTFRGGAVVACDDVDLQIEAGELLVLLGPSGCGKTTALRLICGFERPDQGVIEINGRRVADSVTSVPPERRRVGMVFQDFALFPHLNVRDNVAYGIRRDPDRHVRVSELLDMVGLANAGSLFPHQLSGGMQQRVAVARALAPRPDVILLDEPFSNLDQALRTQLRVEVRDVLRRAQATALFVTHDQEEALTLSDRIAIFDSGRIIQEGAPMAVYEQPVTRFAAGFLGEANFLQGRVTALEPDGLARIALDIGGEASCRLSSGQVGQTVLLALRPEKITLATGGQAGLNALRGKVLDVVFSGNSTTYRIAVGEQVMILFRQNLAQGTVAPGTEVVLSWSPDHLVQVTP
jgi:ABC-type Fe3+/spermidine/putrescine transport system ATPase subunit